ncbi:MAG: hypothetical protein NC218_11680 [Acetobacter sp.]|nr:hypothetical protein [Acetobacter sp.]
MIVTVLLWIIIGALIIAGGIFLIAKVYDLEEIGAILLVVGAVFVLIGAVYGGLLFSDRIHEQGIYEKCVVEQQTLEDALNNSTDSVVTAELYTKAIEFNKDLTYKQYLYERGGYIPYSGKYDWSAIPLVTIPQ